jgi:hypothetical protein
MFIPLPALLRFAALASRSCYYAAPKDGSERKPFGRFAEIFVCQRQPTGKGKLP